jgi:hypothetical protein
MSEQKTVYLGSDTVAIVNAKSQGTYVYVTIVEAEHQEENYLVPAKSVLLVIHKATVLQEFIGALKGE